MATASTGTYYPRSEPLRLLEAFKIQRQVIGALILREIKTRFWRNKLGYFWAIVEPSLHVAVLETVGFYARVQQRNLGGPDTLQIIVSGVVPFFLYRNIAQFITASIGSNLALLRYPNVKLMDVIFARFILEVCTVTTSGTVLTTALVLVGLMPVPRDALGIIIPCAVLAFIGLGWGICFSVLCQMSSTAWNMLILIIMIIFMTSGVFFSGANMPEQILLVMSYNPIFNCIALYREAYFHNFHVPYVNIWYSISWAAGSILLGLSMVRVWGGRLKES